MIGSSQLINTFSRPCFTDTTDIFKDGSGVALYGLDYDASDAGGASGKFGEAAIFNGSSSKIVVEDSSANAFGFANMTGSISAWLNPAVLGTSMGIAAKRDQGSPGNRQWIFRKYSDNKIQFYAYQTDSNSQVVISTSTIPQDSWTHVVVTLTTSEMKIYLNRRECTWRRFSRATTSIWCVGSSTGTCRRHREDGPSQRGDPAG